MLTWLQSARNPISKDLNFKDSQVLDAPPIPPTGDLLQHFVSRTQTAISKIPNPPSLRGGMPPNPPYRGPTSAVCISNPKPPSLKSQTLLLQGEDAPRSPLQGTTFSGLYLEPKPPSLKSQTLLRQGEDAPRPPPPAGGHLWRSVSWTQTPFSKIPNPPSPRWGCPPISPTGDHLQRSVSRTQTPFSKILYPPQYRASEGRF